MSSGHAHESKRAAAELNALLDEALANPKIKARLARPFKLNMHYDIPYLGSSAVGGRTVYIDRHLRQDGMPQGVIAIGGKDVDTQHPLIRHERLEQACEDELGWPYELAHEVATRWEHRWLTEHKIDPAAYEASLKPFLKADAHERLIKVPTDLDLRPEMAPPVSEGLLAHLRKAMNKEKVSQGYVDYQDTPRDGKQCSKCSMFLSAAYGGPACTLVRDPVVPNGYCRRFRAGALDGGFDH